METSTKTDKVQQKCGEKRGDVKQIDHADMKKMRKVSGEERERERKVWIL